MTTADLEAAWVKRKTTQDDDELKPLRGTRLLNQGEWLLRRTRLENLRKHISSVFFACCPMRGWPRTLKDR